MRTLHLILFLLLAAVGSAQSTFDLTSALYFPSDGSTLDRQGREELDELVADLSAYAGFTVRIEAFTDERGSTAYNEALARRRAESVVTALADRGITATGLEVLTYGERRARRGTQTDEERRHDRRVDLVATVTPYTSLAAVDRNWRSDQRQTRTVDPAQLQTIEGEKGGLFFVEANSLTYPDGTPATGPVHITLRESYDLSDMVLSGLTTRAEARLLETGGMIELRATDEAGRELVLGKDKVITAALPATEFREGMRLFSGDAPQADGTPGNWVEAPGAVARRLVDLPVPTTSPRPPAEPWMYEKLILPILVRKWEGQNPVCEVGNTFADAPPRRPTPPDTNRVYYPVPTGLKGLFASKVEIEAKNRERRRQEMGRYAVRLERWERAMADYSAKKTRFEAAIVRGETLNEQRKVRRDSFIRATKIGIGERYEREIAAINAEIAAWQRERQAILAQYRRDRLDAAVASGTAGEGAAAATSYFLSISQLGWINCDRYYRTPDPVEVIATLADAPSEATVMIVPEGTRSVLRLSAGEESGHWSVSGLPRDLSYRIVAYYVRDGQLMLGYQSVAAAGTDVVTVPSEPVSADELPARLRAILGS